MGFLKGLFKRQKSVQETKNNVILDGILRNVNPKSLWKIEDELGDGAYGKVYKAALKTIEFDSEDQLVDHMVEIEILMTAKHPNILTMHETYIFDQSLWLFLELCSGGALDSIMETLDKPLSEPQIQFVAREMLMGLSFLHENRIIHRDLKAGNVLITASAEIRLADFGASAKLKDDRQKSDTFIGTPYWMAPEVINCETLKATPYNHLADVWSLGITFIELCQMRPPHDSTNPTRVLFRITRSDPPTLEKPDRWSKEFNQIIARCLKKDPSQRPECKELLYDPFVMDVCEDDRKHIRLLLCELKADVEDLVEDFSVDSTERSGDTVGLVTTLDDILSADEDEGLVTGAFSEDSPGISENDAPELVEQPVKPDSPIALPSFPVDKVLLDAVLQQLVEDLIENVMISETQHPSLPSCIFEVMRELNQAADILTSGSTAASPTHPVPTRPASVDSAKSNGEETGPVVPATIDRASPHPTTTSEPAVTQSTHTAGDPSKKTNRRNTLYTTVTRTRRFVVDGEEVMTKTRRVIPNFPEAGHLVAENMQKRKAELRAIRMISKQEFTHIYELTHRANQLKDQLEAKLSAEGMTHRRNYELRLESVSRNYRTNVEKLEKDHEADVKRIRAESAKKEQVFRDNLKTEINGYENRAERKTCMREMRKWLQSSQLSAVPAWSSGSSMGSVNSTTSANSSQLNTGIVHSITARLDQFREEQSVRLQRSLQRMSTFFFEQYSKLLQAELVEKQTMRSEFEQERWRIDQRHMHARYQLDRTRMQDFFLIKRYKLARILDLDLTSLRQATIAERESLALRHALVRKQFAKNAKAITKRVLNDFNSSSRQTVPASQLREKIHELEEATQKEINSEREQMQALLLQDAQTLEQSILSRGSELEESHMRQRNELIDHERECLEELDQQHADDLQALREALPQAQLIMRAQFAQELEDLPRPSDGHLSLSRSRNSNKSRNTLFSLYPRSSSLLNLASATGSKP